MKIEKITDNKIRIILNLDDLRAKNIDLHSLMSSPIDSQDLFVEMLDEAEKEVGFYVKDARVLIEALASSDGQFIFTITKVEEDVPKKKHVKIKRKTVKSNCNRAIYKFESFDEFCNFCNYINNGKINVLEGFAKKSSLYLYNNTYYLVIVDINMDFPDLKGFYAIASEFAKHVDYSKGLESKLVEYGKPIMKRNALKRSLQYFGN